jgi:hypothetical protein
MTICAARCKTKLAEMPDTLVLGYARRRGRRVEPFLFQRVNERYTVSRNTI